MSQPGPIVPPSNPEPLWLSPKAELVAAIFAGVLLFAGWLMRSVASPDSAAQSIGLALQCMALAIGLFYGGRAALESLRQGSFDIDVLMVIGAVMAAVLGAPAEGALLLFLFVLSGALEALALLRTRRAVEALSKLMPTSAQKWTGESTGWQEVSPESLLPGDRVRILPGELVPTDSTVTVGSTAIDQATLTGESMPREVFPGDEVFAGTINVGNPVEASVLRPASQSSLQKILHLVIEAQQQREPVQRFIDRVSQPYAIAVTVVSIAVFFVWWQFVGQTARDAFYTAITLLIVASPCALIISTPTATLAAISRGARGGVLFKGGQSIERLAGLQTVAFDKTGTLTIGRPRVMQIHGAGQADVRNMVSIAAGLEEHSTHPIAEAIVKLAKDRSIAPSHFAQAGYVAGRGVEGVIDGKTARLGSLSYTRDLLPAEVALQAGQMLSEVQHRGHIGVVLAFDEQAAVFVLSDAARPGAECLVQRLHEQGVRPVVMLTGDNGVTAARVAGSLGLDEFHADLLPPDKVDHVRRLKAGTPESGPRRVGVIGDGVNDAPALATADVSIAIGSIGSDAALESADIVLLSDDLSAVPWAVGLARRARRTISINLAFSLSAILVMAVATLLGAAWGYRLPLWLGVVGHEGGTLLVVSHSLLLLLVPGIKLCTCDKTAHQRAQPYMTPTISAQPTRVQATASAS